jgi:hypothetical protein
MSSVEIKQDGFYFRNADGVLAKLTDDVQAARCLRFPVHVDSGVTLASVCRSLGPLEALVMILACYNRCNVSKHIQEVLGEPLPGGTCDFTTLVVEKDLGFWDDVIQPVVDIATEAYAIGPGEETGKLIKFSFDLVDPALLGQLPVMVSNRCHVSMHGGLRASDVYGLLPPEFYNDGISLLDFLDAIFEELSFYGSREEKLTTLQTLKKTMEEYPYSTAGTVKADVEKQIQKNATGAATLPVASEDTTQEDTSSFPDVA